MARFPVEVFTRDHALLGYDDDYKSSLLGQKFVGWPKGVYVGCAPSVSPPSPVLALVPDGIHGYSLIKLPSQGDPAGIDLVIPGVIALDFTGQPNPDFPIHVLARADYTDDPDTPTTAEIFTRSASFGAPAWNEVLICVISGTPTTLSAAWDASLGERDAPLALSGVEFGFMPAGSIEDLQTAADTVAEIVAARVGLDSTVHDSLSDRLAEDLSASSMAGRLSLTHRVLRSNDYAIGAGASEINVSGSFAQVNRDHAPEITLNGLGSETTQGAISAPNDQTRNIAIIQNRATGYRPINDPTSRGLVFGRIEGPEDVTVSGEWTFSNASVDVTGDGGSATVELQVGDTILGPDGLFYEIATILTDDSLELRDEYRGVDATSGGLSARRWMLKLRKLVSGTESSTSLPSPTAIRFFFSAFLSMAQSFFDYRLAMHSSLEREKLPLATTDVPGRVRLADASSKIGAVNIQNAGVPLGGGPFHTINFSDGQGQVQQTDDGEVTVGEIGLQGPDGPAGSSGAPGDPGPQGVGYSQINTFELSGDYTGDWPANPVGNAFSFTRAAGHTIRHISGGIALWQDYGFFSFGTDYIEITNITGVGTTTGQVDGFIKGDNRCQVYFSSAGD